MSRRSNCLQYLLRLLQDNSMSVNFPIRVLIAILAFLGVMVSYMLRVNFNIAIVTMTDSDDVDIECKNQSSDHQ